MTIRIRYLLIILVLMGVGLSRAQAGIKRVPVGDAEVIQPSQAKYRNAKVIRAAPVKGAQAPVVRKGKFKTKTVDPKVLEPEVAAATAESVEQAAIVANDEKWPMDPELRRALETSEVEVLDLAPAEATALAEALEEAGVHNVSDAAPTKPVVEKKKPRRSKK